MQQLDNRRGFSDSIKRMGQALLQPLVAIIIGLVIGGFVIAATGNNPIEIYKTLFSKGFFSPAEEWKTNLFYISTTLVRATPILFAAIAASMCWQGGYYNLGGEGQMTLGAFVSVIVALYVPLPGVLRILVAILAGMLAGGLLSMLGGLLARKFSVPLVISSLMMNYIINYWTQYAVSFPLKDNSLDGLVAQSYQIEDAFKLPQLLQGQQLHLGFIFALLCLVIIHFVMRSTVFGYEGRMGGFNPNFAQYGGVKRVRTMFFILLLSGAVAGLGGVSEALGLKYRFVENMISSPSYAWTGLMVTLISRFHPVGMLFTSILLAGIQTGASAVQRSASIPLEISYVIQGVITLFVSAQFLPKLLPAIQAWRKKRGGQTKPESANGGDA